MISLLETVRGEPNGVARDAARRIRPPTVAPTSTHFHTQSHTRSHTHTKHQPEIFMSDIRGDSEAKQRVGAPATTLRSRRRREEAVRRLVADVQSQTNADTNGDWMVITTVATALEKRLDRELHTELVQETKDNAGRIGQICHDHADVFLTSVAQVAALGEPCADLANGLEDAQKELLTKTAGPMHQAAQRWEHAQLSYNKAKTLHAMVHACQQVAVQMERARKMAGNPREALEAVEQARSALATPVEAIWEKDAHNKEAIESLEQTPFGKRAAVIIPKIENEVLMSARRNLNRWFLALRNGDGATAGRSALRDCADSFALGPGMLGIGGNLPQSYVWRAKTADNLISRVDQNGKVARSIRLGYWFDRDAPKEAQRLESTTEGLERKAEAFASAFGWYRCWSEMSMLLVDPADYQEQLDSSSKHSRGSKHGLRGSRHSAKKSLGFKASTPSRSLAFQEVSSALGNVPGAKAVGKLTKWSDLLTPPLLLEDEEKRRLEAKVLFSLPEGTHPVRRAELAYSLLGRSDEFIQYYEQNRFGDTKIDGDRKSYLSALTGDDINAVGSRIFFSKTFPHVCSNVIGFSAVEAALQSGNHVDDEDSDGEDVPVAKKGDQNVSTLGSNRFKDASERYERALINEVSDILQLRSKEATLVELARSSALITSMRGALKVVHPLSSTRRADKDLLAGQNDILTSAIKLARDEMLTAALAIVAEDKKSPMLASDSYSGRMGYGNKVTGVPDPEELDLPFGLASMKQIPKKTDDELQREQDEAYTYSQSVPTVVRALHARCIVCAAFALSREEIGQKFPEKEGSDAAGFVMDCVEACVNTAAIGLKDSDHLVEEGSVEKAVQVMANIVALQRCLPRMFGTMIRGMCHVGLIRADEIEDAFVYAEKILKNADKACDTQVGSTYSLVYEICRNKIDTHVNYALENFNWVAKAPRDMPNAYVEGIIGYLKSVFGSLGPMDEGSRAGLHFSCLGHISERLVKLLGDRPGDMTTMDPNSIPPISRIDAYGIKNLQLDCDELERFADSTGIPQLRDCFSELRVLTTVMLDMELPSLLLPENSGARRRKYPILSLEKVCNILEKYQTTGFSLMGGPSRDTNILNLEKKELQQLIKIVKTQVIS